jgi:hypothetical protein
LQESNQEEERKNKKPTQLDGILQESNQGMVTRGDLKLIALIAREGFIAFFLLE